MKKKILSAGLAFVLLFGAPASASGETFYGDSGWRVAFTEDEAMDSNFKTADLNDVVGGLQPGDNVIITLTLQDDHTKTTDWYMTNEVLYSLEDRSANAGTSGGAYTYRLEYTDKNGEVTTLFDSDTVGGEDSDAGEGLHGATSALEDYIYLDTLATGEKGAITLEVALDGETQGNAYQDTLADLQMNFAVEMSDEISPPTAQDERTPTSSESRSVTNRASLVRTGDESRTLLFLGLIGASGLVLLFFSLRHWRENQRRQEEGER